MTVEVANRSQTYDGSPDGSPEGVPSHHVGFELGQLVGAQPGCWRDGSLLQEQH